MILTGYTAKYTNLDLKSEWKFQIKNIFFLANVPLYFSNLMCEWYADNFANSFDLSQFQQW
jgi:hypothetical protein